MPLTKRTLAGGTFCRTLYAGQLVSVKLLKRDDDQREGVVRSITLFNVRRSRVIKTGEPIQGEMSANETTVWHIPRFELTKNGVDYINAADRIVEFDQENPLRPKFIRYWQPEADGDRIAVQLFGSIVVIQCKRIDPPGQQIG